MLQSLVICLCLIWRPGLIESAWAQVPETKPEQSASVESPSPDATKRLPMGALHIDDRSAAIPDWQMVSFNAFPPFSADGQWGDVAWSQGDRLVDVLTLGDFQGALDLQLLTVASIGEALGMPTSLGRKHPIYLIKLDQFPLLERQTIASLAAAVPVLLDMPIDKLPLIQDLVKSVHPTFVFRTKTLEALLFEHPEFGEIKLSKLILQDYQLGDLPGIEVVPLQSFAHWQEATISEVPMLPMMSWWLFPGRPQLDGEMAIASVRPLVSTAADAADTGDATAAAETYALVLTPRTGFEPTEWVVGDEGEMSVSATGLQTRSRINDGKEFKGAFPFGPAFQVVPESISPTGIGMAMYFRTCRQALGRVDCSGYGIGPIPLQTYRPGETVFLGEYAFPVTPLPPEPAVSSKPAPLEPTTDFFDVVVDAAIEHKGPIGTVVMIFTLLGGVLWWTWRGDPIQFFVLTVRWLMATQIYRRLNRQKPKPSTLEPSDADK
jgi:hypothetical protein